MINKNNIILSNQTNNYNINSNLNKRKIKAYEIRQFLKSSDWKINEEFTDKKLFKNIRTNIFINGLKSFI